MTIVMNTDAVSFVFQPEFPGLFFLILRNGKTWVLILLGPLLALIPDFLYASVQYIYATNPSQKIVRMLKQKNRVGSQFN